MVGHAIQVDKCVQYFYIIDEQMLKSYLVRFAVVYPDDVLIFRKMKEEHMMHLRQVLEQWKHESLLINLQNLSFMKEELMYLGTAIS